MNSIKINKIAAVWLLTVVVVRFGTASQPELVLQRYIDDEMYIVGHNPKIGEIFEVVYRITVKATADWTERKSYLTHNYAAVIRGPAEALEIIGQDKFFFSGLKIGETKEFRVNCRILKSWNWIQITGSVALVYQGKIRGDVAGKAGIPLYLINPETGQYGTKEQWLNRGIGVLGKYNNVEPQWLSEPDPAWAESNRKIAEEMRKFEPALTDSEALCLHQDNYFLIINAVGDPNATDSARIEHLLEAGWLDAQRSGAESKETWFQEFMEKNKGNWGGNSNLNFFRDDSSDRDTDGTDGVKSQHSTLKPRLNCGNL